MVKNYVLDTNILLHDPHCLSKFEDNVVYVTHPVIEELDGFKDAHGELGFNAREAIRYIDEAGKVGDLLEGVKLDNGGMLKMYATDWLELADLPSGFDKRKMDNLILLCVKAIESELQGKAAIKIQEESGDVHISEEALLKRVQKEVKVILVSNDTIVRLKACLMGIEVQEYRNYQVNTNKLYSGRSIRHLTDNDMLTFSNEGRINADKLYDEDLDPLVRNEYVTLLSWQGSSFLSKFDGKYLNALDEDKICSWIETRNAGQRFLQHSLMTSYKERPLTICCGPAGTGKTLLALACGLEQVMDKEIYKKVLLCRANVMMDEEIGFLPGDEKDKIDPLLRGAYDNLEIMLRDENETNRQYEDKVAELFQRGYLDAQSVGYLRGRSITDTYIIIDEAQNCTPNQILSIITRAGDNSKIVLLGDPNQIDNSRLDKRNNGLVYAKERMKGSILCDVITFEESECTRSPLAKEASEKLKR